MGPAANFRPGGSEVGSGAGGAPLALEDLARILSDQRS